MATASDNPDSAMKAMENELSCYICFNLLSEPKDLDCSHTYCLLCLQDWVCKKPTIDCPECRHITIVPAGGLVNLKTNLRLKNMVEMYAAHVGKQRAVPICQNHEGERQHFFCMTCGVTVCRDCLVLDHERPRHKIKELKVITKTRKTEMRAKLDQVQAEIRKVEEEKKKFNEIERQMQATKDQVKSKVRKRVHEIIAEAEAKGKETTDRIEVVMEERLKTLREEENRAAEQGKRLRNVQAATQTAVDTAVDHVYMKQHASLVDKMEKMCITKRGTPTSDMAYLSFEPGYGALKPSWFGNLAEKKVSKLTLKLPAEFGKFQQVLSIAATQTGLLAVVDYDVKEVIVYHIVNGKYTRQFRLGVSSDNPDAKLILPGGVAVTSDNKFLVIDEWKAMKVFSPTGKYERKFSMQGSRITTTTDDTIVICSKVRKSITLHKPSLELLRTHQIESGDIADITTNGKQIAFTRYKEGKLYVIDFESGKDLWKLDMTFPLGVCFVEKSNSILVAGNSKDRGNMVIEQYCSTTGRFVSRVAYGLYNPLAMIITHGDNLVVADWKTVKVYKIK